MYLNRDAILARPALPRESVEVPEWGGPVFVREMTGVERDRFEATHAKAPNDNFRARLAAATICDDAGKRLFSEADVAALGEASSVALDRIGEAALRLNKFGDKQAEAGAKN